MCLLCVLARPEGVGEHDDQVAAHEEQLEGTVFNLQRKGIEEHVRKD
jgi:hypothetical protein